MLHFAYGSNMDPAAMRRRCPGAVALGPAWLDNWRFMVTRDGYASIAPAAGTVVHGVLWRLTPRDLAAVNAYESLDSGLYRRRILPVRRAGGCVSALVYVARERRPGRPKPGYQDLVVAAACAWDLPEEYVDTLRRWSPSRLPAVPRHSPAALPHRAWPVRTVRQQLHPICAPGPPAAPGAASLPYGRRTPTARTARTSGRR